MLEVSPKEEFFALAIQAREQLNFSHAVALLDKAERAGYSADACAAERWICHMFQGDFEHAWKEADDIADRGAPDPLRLWDGQPLTGKRLMIRCLHGLGDTIQFIRFVPTLRKQASRIIIEAPRRILGLLERIPGIDEAITWEDKPHVEPPWDQQVEIMEIPRLLRLRLADIPGSVPYLVPNLTLDHGFSLPSGRLRIGICWAAGSFDSSRSIPLEFLRIALEFSDVDLYSVQFGPEAADLAYRNAKNTAENRVCPFFPAANRPQNRSRNRVCPLILPLIGEGDDLDRTAAKMAALDLVITVDTMIAHLAGALGKPVWTLLPAQCNWRWMANRTDSPWYPTMRLFRQSKQDDWQPVAETLQAALQELSGHP